MIILIFKCSVIYVFSLSLFGGIIGISSLPLAMLYNKYMRDKYKKFIIHKFLLGFKCGFNLAILSFPFVFAESSTIFLLMKLVEYLR